MSHSDVKLDGRWTLNKDQSDDASDRLKSSQPRRDNGNGDPGMSDPGMGRGGVGGVGMGIPGIGGIGGMGRGRRRNQESGSNSGEQAHIRELLQPSSELTFNRKDPEIDVTDSDYRVHELFTDGRKLAKAQGTHTPVTAKWDHDSLVTDERGPDGQKVTRNYKVSDDGKQLYETVTIEPKSSKSSPVSVRHVYDKSAE